VRAVLRQRPTEMFVHFRRQLDNAEQVRLRLLDESLDRGKSGVARLDVRDDEPERRLRPPGRSRRGSHKGNPDHSNVDCCKRCGQSGESQPSQHKAGESRSHEHGDVLHSKQVGGLEHPHVSIQQPEQRRRADQRDDARDETTERTCRTRQETHSTTVVARRSPSCGGASRRERTPRMQSPASPTRSGSERGQPQELARKASPPRSAGREAVRDCVDRPFVHERRTARDETESAGPYESKRQDPRERLLIR
jgi:hypothetical protein